MNILLIYLDGREQVVHGCRDNAQVIQISTFALYAGTFKEENIRKFDRTDEMNNGRRVFREREA